MPGKKVSRWVGVVAEWFWRRVGGRFKREGRELFVVRGGDACLDKAQKQYGRRQEVE